MLCSRKTGNNAVRQITTTNTFVLFKVFQHSSQNKIIEENISSHVLVHEALDIIESDEYDNEVQLLGKISQ